MKRLTAIALLCGVALPSTLAAQAYPPVAADARRMPLPHDVRPAEVMALVRGMGFVPLRPPLRRGAIYEVRAADDDDVAVKVLINARSGEVVGVMPARVAGPPGPARVGDDDGDTLPPLLRPPGPLVDPKGGSAASGPVATGSSGAPRKPIVAARPQRKPEPKSEVRATAPAKAADTEAAKEAAKETTKETAKEGAKDAAKSEGIKNEEAKSQAAKALSAPKDDGKVDTVKEPAKEATKEAVKTQDGVALRTTASARTLPARWTTKAASEAIKADAAAGDPPAKSDGPASDKSGEKKADGKATQPTSTP
jgi:hypothetical protein